MTSILIITLPLLFMCLSAFKAGEIYHYNKITNLFDEAFEESKTVEDLDQRMGWVDCLLYMMRNPKDK